MSDSLPKKVVVGEVLPAVSRQTINPPSLPPGTPFGIPMLGRAKFEAHAKAMRAYVDFRRAQRELVEVETSLVGAVEARLAAEQRVAIALNRHKHLDKILMADEAQFLSEIADIYDRIASKQADKQQRGRIAAYEDRIALANLEAEALEAEARVERLKNPTPQKSEPQERLTAAQRAARDIAAVKRDRSELRAALIAAAGGEENLTEDDRSHLDTLDLSAENKIREIMEGL